MMRGLLFGTGLLLTGPSLYAHHGNFTYDGNTIITLEGRVQAFNWTNPHGSIELITPAGNEVLVEIDGPSLIAPMGVSPDSLMPGEHIIVYASPSNRGREDEVLGREVLRDDGSMVRVSVAYARRLQERGDKVTDSVLGTWVPDRRNLFSHVAASEGWNLTPAGQASFDAYDPADSFAQANCIAATAPTLMMYPTANVLVQEDSRIVMDADWMGAKRIVYMDGREHPGKDALFDQGHSIGHWEGDALVIDTRNFAPNPIGNVFSIASGTGKYLVERLELAGDGRELTYSYTLTDPEYLDGEVTGNYTWHFRPDVMASSVGCDRNAARRYLQ